VSYQDLATPRAARRQCGRGLGKYGKAWNSAEASLRNAIRGVPRYALAWNNWARRWKSPQNSKRPAALTPKRFAIDARLFSPMPEWAVLDASQERWDGWQRQRRGHQAGPHWLARPFLLQRRRKFHSPVKEASKAPIAQLRPINFPRAHYILDIFSPQEATTGER